MACRSYSVVAHHEALSRLRPGFKSRYEHSASLLDKKSPLRFLRTSNLVKKQESAHTHYEPGFGFTSHPGTSMPQLCKCVKPNHLPLDYEGQQLILYAGKKAFAENSFLFPGQSFMPCQKTMSCVSLSFFVWFRQFLFLIHQRHKLLA